jgi:hypothetical protein
MDQDQEKQALEKKLARYQRLIQEFPEGETARNLRELMAELERKIRALES